MELFKKITFKHEECMYEIRVLHKDNLINIAAFLNNHPANGFRYQIQRTYLSGKLVYDISEN